MRKIFILFILTVPLVSFANSVENNHYEPVWDMLEAKKIPTTKEQELLELYQNPFNYYFVVNPKYVDYQRISYLINKNIEGKEAVPYETLFFVFFADIFHLCSVNSPAGKWCKKNKEEYFCKIFTQYQKNELELLETAYNIFKAMAAFYAEPFNIDINKYKNCIMTEKCPLSDEPFLLYNNPSN